MQIPISDNATIQYTIKTPIYDLFGIAGYKYTEHKNYLLAFNAINSDKESEEE